MLLISVVDKVKLINKKQPLITLIIDPPVGCYINEKFEEDIMIVLVILKVATSTTSENSIATGPGLFIFTVKDTKLGTVLSFHKKILKEIQ